MAEATGPIVRPSPIDPLELEAWPITCVLAWIIAVTGGRSPGERDDLVRQAYKHEARALPVDVMTASRKLLDFAAAYPDRLTLRHQGGVVDQSLLGPDAMIFPTDEGGRQTFALRPHLVIRSVDDYYKNIVGVWCLAREVRAAWPDRVVGATNPAAADHISRWKPTWLSLAGAIMWVVARDMTLVKSTDEQADNDHSTISGISLRLAQARQQTGEPVNLHVGLAEAWPAIRRLVGDGKILAEGTPIVFKGRQDGTGIWRTFEAEAIPSRSIRKVLLNNDVPGIAPKDALAQNKLSRATTGFRYWTSVFVRADDLFREFPAEPVMSTAEQIDRNLKKRGRKKTVQYAALEAETLRLMNHHGEFSDDDPEWNGVEKLIAALQQFHSKKFEMEPGRSTLQRYVPTWLVKYRSTPSAEK